MVQDTGLGQEMFVSAYKGRDDKLVCYQYTEDPVDMNSHEIPSDYLGERTLIYCVSPPGETPWLRQRLYGSNNSPLEKAFDGLTISQTDKPTAPSSSQRVNKFPLPHKDHVSAAVKFYSSTDSIRVGQLIEVIGVLTNPSSSNIVHDNEEEDGFRSALGSLDVPVVHAITHRSLEGQASNAFSSGDVIPDMPHHDIRAKLIEYLSAGLGGDKLAAEFVLLMLVSRVTNKNRGVKVGHFTLNLTNFPDCSEKLTSLYEPSNKATRVIFGVLENIVHHCVVLPLSIDLLNKTEFMPRSVNESLHSGILQLSTGTLLLVDETALTEGKLVDKGVRNIQALSNVINHQSLTYMFPYSQFEFDTDLLVMTLSHGKSMLPNQCSLRLDPTYYLDEVPQLTETSLEQFRMYMQDIRHLEYDIPEDVSLYIQNAFVNERKSATANGTTLPTQEDLMLRVSLARMVSLSFGEPQLSKSSYDYATRLDVERKDRFLASSTPMKK
ncbi:putative alanine racemase-domain-containing protein [Dichotomocladium elegans]|nr:putative alanine racemase-domain-containing protein [Dichotomocladium elegans]